MSESDENTSESKWLFLRFWDRLRQAFAAIRVLDNSVQLKHRTEALLRQHALLGQHLGFGRDPQLRQAKIRVYGNRGETISTIGFVKITLHQRHRKYPSFLFRVLPASPVSNRRFP
jgi:hypothetical protein